MIKEEYVSFETAKLLKEKGFSEKCTACYHEEISPRFELISGRVNYCNPRFQKFKMKPPINAPTHQVALKWLREVHNLVITVSIGNHKDHRDENAPDNIYYFFAITDNKAFYDDEKQCTKEYSTWEEATEEAIKYSLENLI